MNDNKNQEKNILELIDLLHTQAVEKHKQGELTEAVELYQKAIAIQQEQPPWIYGNTITLLTQLEQLDEAISIGNLGISIHPNGEEIFRALGLAFYSQGDLENCIDYYQKAIALNQNQPPWLYSRLIESLITNSKIEEAINIGKQGVELYPNSEWISYHLAQGLIINSQWDEAIFYLNEAIKIIPDSYWFYQNLFQVFTKQERWQDALVAYCQALNLNPKLTEARKNLLAKTNNNESETDEAEQYSSLAKEFQEHSQWTESALAYSQAIQQDHNNCWLANSLGDVLSQLEWFEDAVLSYRCAIQLNPNHSWTYYNLGNCLVQLQQWQEAAAAYRSASELNPDHPWTHYLLGDALIDCQEFQLASQAYHRALELQPDLLAARHRLAEILQVQGQMYLKEAYQHYGDIIQTHSYDLKVRQKMLEVSPGNSEVYLHLGNNLAQQNRLDAALFYYQVALKAYPNIDWIPLELEKTIADSNLSKAEYIRNSLYEIFKNIADLPSLYSKLADFFQANNSKLSDLFYRKFLDYKFLYAEIYFQKANILSKQNMYQEAIKSYDRAISLNPEKKWFYKSLGDTLLELNNFTRGIFYLKKAIELDHQNEDFIRDFKIAQLRETQWLKVHNYCEQSKNSYDLFKDKIDPNKAKKILVITAYPPYPPNTGGAIRMFEKIKYLGKRHHVVVVSFISELEEFNIDEGLSNYCDLSILVKVGKPLNPRQLNEPLKIHWWTTREMWQVLSQLQKIDFDIVTFDFIFTAPYQQLFSHTFTILEEHNIESTLLKQCHTNVDETDVQKELEEVDDGGAFQDARKEAEFLKAYEDKMWPLFDLRTVVSEVDKQQLDSRCREGKTIVIDNGVDTKQINLIDNSQGKKLFYMGHMGYYPNIDAVCYFVQEVLPLVWEQDPTVSLCIAGRDPAPQVQELTTDSRIELVANPETMSSVAVNCNICVVPLRLGSGTRLKILHAMAMGLPIISTSVGAEGLLVTEGEEILIRDSAESFAEAVLQLNSDTELCQKLRLNGRKLVEHKYDWESIFSKYEQQMLLEWEQKNSPNR